MRAIVLEKFGGLDSLVYKDIPAPEPKAGHVVIEIKVVRHQPCRDAYAPGRVGRGGSSQRH
jgi:NADPH:quinone reductase-like Zn-dependent oxidoreductase